MKITGLIMNGNLGIVNVYVQSENRIRKGKEFSSGTVVVGCPLFNVFRLNSIPPRWSPQLSQLTMASHTPKTFLSALANQVGLQCPSGRGYVSPGSLNYQALALIQEHSGLA